MYNEVQALIASGDDHSCILVPPQLDDIIPIGTEY